MKLPVALHFVYAVTRRMVSGSHYGSGPVVGDAVNVTSPDEVQMMSRPTKYEAYLTKYSVIKPTRVAQSVYLERPYL